MPVCITLVELAFEDIWLLKLAARLDLGGTSNDLLTAFVLVTGLIDYLGSMAAFK